MSALELNKLIFFIHLFKIDKIKLNDNIKEYELIELDSAELSIYKESYSYRVAWVKLFCTFLKVVHNTRT